MKDNRLLIWIAVGIIAACFVYFFAVTFIQVPEGGKQYANLILGALIGSGFTALIAYYYGSSKGSGDKTAILGKGGSESPKESDMKKIIALLLLGFLTVLVSVPAFAAPSLVCDPQAGVTYYKITGDAYWTASVPAQADGSVRTDLAGIPSGTHSIKVAACKNDPLWGEQCSAAIPFDFTRPTVPGAPTNMGLAP